MELKKILVPIDFSEDSEHALSVACDLARQYGSSLVILHVYQLPTAVFPEETIPVSPDHYKSLSQYFRESLENAQKRAQEQCGESVPVSYELRLGAPWHEITGMAKEQEFDLIVVGSHGRTTVERFLLGSVAQRVLRKSPCTVMVTRRKEASPQ